MATEDLIDSIVANETLGIRKKPSLFKALLVVLVLIVVAFMAYALFLKLKPPPEQAPRLELGQPLDTHAAPIKHANSELGALSNMAEDQKQHNDQLAAQLAAPSGGVNLSNVVAAAESKLPITQAVAAQPAVIQPAVTSAIAGKSDKQPVDIAKTEQLNMAPVKTVAVDNSAASIAANEQVVSEILTPKPKNMKQVHRKLTKKSVNKVVEKQNSKEVQVSATPIEEGVTREEVIVVQ